MNTTNTFGGEGGTIITTNKKVRRSVRAFGVVVVITLIAASLVPLRQGAISSFVPQVEAQSSCQANSLLVGIANRHYTARKSNNPTNDWGRWLVSVGKGSGKDSLVDEDAGITPFTAEEMDDRVGRWGGWYRYRKEFVRVSNCVPGSVQRSYVPRTEDRRTAKECFEARPDKGERCGPGGNDQILISRDFSGPQIEGAVVQYYLFANTPPTNGTIPVTYTFSGRHSGGGSVSVPREGIVLGITLPSDNLSQLNEDLTITWNTSGSMYSVYSDHVTDTIAMVDDDATVWYWSEGDLSKGRTVAIAEGGVLRTGEIVFDSNSGLPAHRASNTLHIAMAVSGCALVSTEPTSSDASVAGDIPCYVHIHGAQRTSASTFTISDWDPTEVLLLQIKVGKDDDDVNEEITITPTFTFADSGGGFVEQTPASFPTSFSVYDDEKSGIQSTPVSICFTQSTYTLREDGVSDRNSQLPTVTWGGTPERDYLIPYIFTSITATNGADYSGSPGSFRVLSGVDSSSIRLGVSILDDNNYEKTESFSVSISSGQLPSGVQIGVLNDSQCGAPVTPSQYISAAVNIIDDDKDPSADPEIVLRLITTEVVEDDTIAIDVELTSDLDFDGDVTFRFSDDAGTRLNADHDKVLPSVSLTAGEPSTHTISLSNVISHSSSKESDGWMTVKLVAQKSSYGVKTSQNARKVRIRDAQAIQVDFGLTVANLLDDEVQGLHGDIYLRLLDGGAVIPLRGSEVVEVPITVSYGDRLLRHDEYILTPYKNQSNVTVSKTERGYKVKIAGGTTTTPFSCSATISLNPHALACLNFISMIDSNSVTWVEKTGGKAIDLVFAIDIPKSTATTSHRYGDTNISPGWFHASDSITKPMYQNLQDSTVVRTFTIRPVDGVSSIVEPDTGYAYLPFDLIVSPTPTSGVGYQFCFSDAQGADATYYRDFTIYSATDYNLVQRHPYMARYLTGHAWSSSTGCTRGGLQVSDKINRFYLRVFADSGVEGTEFIKMKVKHIGPAPDGAIPDSATVTFAITE